MIIAMVFLMAALYNQIMILVEFPGDPNPREAYFFETNRYAKFYYDDGTNGFQPNLRLLPTLEIRAVVENATHTNATVFIDGSSQGSFYTNKLGIVYEGGVLDGNYSIWWIKVENPMLLAGEGVSVLDTFSVIDPTGFLGISNQPYTMLVERQRVYWPYGPYNQEEIMGPQWQLLGAQASFDIGLYNKTDNDRVSGATLDMTVGLVEEWHGAQNNEIRLWLYETDFPISRNRLVMFPMVFIFGAIFSMAAYLLMSKKWKAKGLDMVYQEPEQRNEIMMLLGTGVAATAIECVDIWFFAPLGIYLNLFAVHLGFMGVLAVICWRKKYGFRWLLPGLLEIMYVGAIALLTSEPYVPHLTAFMGSLISWMCILFVSGYQKNFEEGDNVIEKFISKFV